MKVALRMLGRILFYNSAIRQQNERL